MSAFFCLFYIQAFYNVVSRNNNNCFFGCALLAELFMWGQMTTKPKRIYQYLDDRHPFSMNRQIKAVVVP